MLISSFLYFIIMLIHLIGSSSIIY